MLTAEADARQLCSEEIAVALDIIKASFLARGEN